MSLIVMTQEEKKGASEGVITESSEQMAERSGMGDGGMTVVVGLGLEVLLPLLLLLLGGK